MGGGADILSAGRHGTLKGDSSGRRTCAADIIYGCLKFFWDNSIGATGFEPATSWSQTRRSSQAELRPVTIYENKILELYVYVDAKTPSISR